MQRHAVAVVGASGLLLAAAGEPPAAALRSLSTLSASANPTAPVVAAVTVLAWLLVIWLAVVVVVGAAAALPGAGGRTAAALARRLSPAAVRRIIELGLGVTLAATATGASPALAAASPNPPAPAAHLAQVDPAVVAPEGASHPSGSPWRSGGLDWPVPQGGAPSHPPERQPGAAPAGGLEPVVVQPGGCLWHIAQAQLQAEGAVEATPTQVAQSWPRWWAANREVIGADPHLVHPGMRLSPPPPG